MRSQKRIARLNESNRHFKKRAEDLESEIQKKREHIHALTVKIQYQDDTILKLREENLVESMSHKSVFERVRGFLCKIRKKSTS